MDTSDFDKAVVTAVFGQAGLVGWRASSLVGAATEAGLDLIRLRTRFPGKGAVLLRFGVLADQAALLVVPAGMQPSGTPRERLFDLVMARFDFLQEHRTGVLALIEALRTDPGTTLMLWGATLRSMRWLLEAAGVPADGLAGALRVQGAGAVWAYTLRAWEKDDSADMSSTMAALDRALDRALQAEEMLPGYRRPVMDDEIPVSPVVTPPTSPGLEPEVDTIPSLSGDDVANTEDGPTVI